MSLYQVIVSIQFARYGRHVRKHRKDILQSEPMERHRHVLQGFMVSIIGIDLNAHAVRGLQLEISREPTVISEVDIVAIVHGKGLVAQDGTWG